MIGIECMSQQELKKQPIKKQVAIAMSFLDNVSIPIPINLKNTIKQHIKNGFWQAYKDYLKELGMLEEKENGETSKE